MSMYEPVGQSYLLMIHVLYLSPWMGLVVYKIVYTNIDYFNDFNNLIHVVHQKKNQPNK